jgi:uncharacterized membrane protein YjfL (UPF0719 family)
MKRLPAALMAALTLMIGAKAALAQTTVPINRTLADDLTRTGLWMGIALVLFLVAYKFADILTPGDLRKQLAEGNTALAIFAGSIIIGFGLIIASLVG